VFVDPGYYQEPPKSELGNFIESNANKAKKPEGKRPIIGPGQLKAKTAQKKSEEDIQPNEMNLIGEPESEKKEASKGTGL
jgi:hypothetical protein